MSDDDSTPEERAQAESLARALDGRGPVPAEVNLLRATRGQLDPRRGRAIAARLRERRRWLLLPTLVAAAAAIIVLLRPHPLPPPGAALLRAQSAALHGGSVAALDSEMAAYRRTLFAR